MLNRKVLLNSGFNMPMIGIGTGGLNTRRDIFETFENAIKVGYRHIDMATVYNNQELIGDYMFEKYLEDPKLKREDFFYVSKVWNQNHWFVRDDLNQTLKDLRTSYLDLLLIHWPVTFQVDPHRKTTIRHDDGSPYILPFEPEKIWRKLEYQVQKGLVRSIGVSNFGIKNITKILESCSIKPAVLQIEFHPFLQQPELVDFCNKNGIKIVAAAPFASRTSCKGPNSDYYHNKVIKYLSRKYDITPGQVILSFIVNKNISVIPRESETDLLIENTKLIWFDEDDMKMLESCDLNERSYDPVMFGPNRFD